MRGRRMRALPVVTHFAAVCVALVAGLLLVAVVVGAPGAAQAAAAQPAAVADRDVVSISGVVYGHGGHGKWAWSLLLPGARVAAVDFSNNKSVTTNALGQYVLTLTLPDAAYADYAIRASRTSYNARLMPVSSDSHQVRDFSGASALVVKGTTLKVTVLKAGKKLKGATVACFGKSVKTDRTGVATLRILQLKPGAKYVAKVARTGLKTASVSFTSRPGGIVRKSVTLRR